MDGCLEYMLRCCPPSDEVRTGPDAIDFLMALASLTVDSTPNRPTLMYATRIYYGGDQVKARRNNRICICVVCFIEDMVLVASGARLFPKHVFGVKAY